MGRKGGVVAAAEEDGGAGGGQRSETRLRLWNETRRSRKGSGRLRGWSGRACEMSLLEVRRCCRGTPAEELS